ncbi:hypothetical protein KUCAC02_013923, partial [Chaenocephalus aceratus]
GSPRLAFDSASSGSGEDSGPLFTVSVREVPTEEAFLHVQMLTAHREKGALTDCSRLNLAQEFRIQKDPE